MECIGRRRRIVVVVLTPMFALATLVCALLALFFFLASRLPGAEDPASAIAKAILFGMLGLGVAGSGLFVWRLTKSGDP